MRKATIVIPAVLLALGAIWQSGTVNAPMGIDRATYLASSVGGPVNYWLPIGDWLTVIAPAAAIFLLMWGVAVMVMSVRRGNWSLFVEHFAWEMGIFFGFMAYVVPGIILLALMLRHFGVKPALLIFLGPIGSAIVASVPGIIPAVRPPLKFPVSFGMSPQLPGGLMV